MKCFRAIAIVLLTFAGTASAMASEPVSGFQLRSTIVHGRTYPYSVFIPLGWTPERAWPMVLFLHGAGERGDDGLLPTQVGLGPLLRTNPGRVPAVVVFPQVPGDERWLGDPAEAAMQALHEAVEEFSGDRERIYLTGISMVATVRGISPWRTPASSPQWSRSAAGFCLEALQPR